MKIEKNCLKCGSTFTTYDRPKENKIYCSRVCFLEGAKTRFAGVNNPFYGKKHTAESRKLISEKATGRPSFRKGQPYYAIRGNKHFNKTPEARLKMSIAKSNPSAETRMKLRMNMLGKPKSKEHIRKMSELRKGKPNLYSRGEKSHFWKGGISTENQKVKGSLEYKKFIRTCYLRDGYRCRKCKFYNSKAKLNVHHIKNFSQYPKLRTLPINGITLCLECHQEFHKLYGKQNNTVSQIQTFLNSKP